ncbi:serine/threonine-protein kinase [Vitiosangium sp. GDMCC 1.1324]|uniref:serine/threonine-protein kinase n=1 Tax=Vitiosangium sp. (strain GDMCC 1.1324) TaxID=2138576 RepID=UPI000D35854F|nr:serine/threonine-protein kinase [Vitiosangium sp. GDMCC 1.1324]PTL78172.1 serine/threonine protein kinase [Vitiosangium sp. GDMCC 1.1324]
MTLEAGAPIGKYVVKRKLAEGGMAEIYLATAMGPEGFEKEVVIKRVRSFLSDDEGFVQMFIAEARLASRLNHANVVQIFDFAKHEDSYYLAMEYVRGCSLWDLRKRCREKGIGMPPLLVAHIGAQVAAGLHYAHRAKSPDGEPLGLVHRDVTPHNVLLSFDGAVKLTDFGIAKAGNKLTQPGVLKGKFAYMSPEQSRGEAVDSRTDVFALGVVLWEMLTGGRLFDGDSELAVLRAVQESVIAPPARLNPDVPEDLDEVVSIALDRDPEARYQSAGELERALAQCVLHRATSVDDTDVGTFVRRLFDVPLTQFIPAPAALQDRSRSRSGSTPVAGTGSGVRARSRTGEAPSVAVAGPDAQVPASPQPVAPAREGTAVMPGSSPSSGRSQPVRTDAAEESLVSASTLVLSRDRAGDEEKKGAPSEPLPPRSTLPLPSAQGGRDSRPVPVTPAARDSRPMPAVSSSSTSVPARVAQVMPPVEPDPAPAGAKRGGKGLWVGVGVAALTLIGGAAALVLPSKEPVPSEQASTKAPETPEAPPSVPPAVSGAKSEVAAAPPAESGVKPEAATGQAASGSAAQDVPDAGAVTAVTPPPGTEPAPAQTGAAAQGSTASPAGTATASEPANAEARGTLIVRAIPFATVTISGQKPREVQGVARFSLPPGSYKVTFAHPSSAPRTYDVTIKANESVKQEFNARRR